MSEANAPDGTRAQADAMFAALNARDFEALADLPIHPDMAFRSAFAVAEGEIYHGVQGLREWAQNVDSTFDDFWAELLDFRHVGDERAVLTVKITGRAKASGIPFDLVRGQAWTWRNGLVSRIDVYTDVREAFEAVGPAE